MKGKNDRPGMGSDFGWAEGLIISMIGNRSDDDRERSARLVESTLLDRIGHDSDRDLYFLGSYLSIGSIAAWTLAGHSPDLRNFNRT